MKLAQYSALCLFSGLLLASNAHAYLSMAESGELVPMGKYQVGIEPQLMLNRGDGGNVDAFFDAPINDSTSARLLIGSGTVDFNGFASVKYIPFPDVDNQPAIGIRGGVGLDRINGNNGLDIQVAPLISKKFDTDMGMTVPYFALPITFTSNNNDSFTRANVAVGTELHSPQAPQVTFGAELGIDLNRSYSYISAYVTLPFDSTKGFGR